MDKFNRANMSVEELAIDNMWLDIMEKYIPDDYTEMKIKCIDNIIVLVIKDEDFDIEICYGYSYYGAFNDSIYLDGLREQDDDYLKSMFNEKEIELIRNY